MGPEGYLIQSKEQLFEIYGEIMAVLNGLDFQENTLPCMASKSYLTMKDWKKIKKNIWSDKKFRNSNPNGECNARATLLSVKLDQLGYKSEKILLKGNKIAASFKTKNGYVVYPYTTHTANVISLMNDKGTISRYVLDPMFTDDLVSIEDYLKGFSCPDQPPLEFIIFEQTSEPAWERRTDEDYIIKENITVRENETCGYQKTIIMGAEKLIRINQQVESKINRNRIYNVFMDYELPILGADKNSAIDSFCSLTN